MLFTRLLTLLFGLCTGKAVTGGRRRPTLRSTSPSTDSDTRFGRRAQRTLTLPAARDDARRLMPFLYPKLVIDYGTILRNTLELDSSSARHPLSSYASPTVTTLTAIGFPHMDDPVPGPCPASFLYPSGSLVTRSRLKWKLLHGPILVIKRTCSPSSRHILFCS